MKNLLNLKGAKSLSKVEQKNVFGGLIQNGGCCVFITYTDGYKAFRFQKLRDYMALIITI